MLSGRKVPFCPFHRGANRGSESLSHVLPVHLESPCNSDSRNMLCAIYTSALKTRVQRAKRQHPGLRHTHRWVLGIMQHPCRNHQGCTLHPLPQPWDQHQPQRAVVTRSHLPSPFGCPQDRAGVRLIPDSLVMSSWGKPLRSQFH